MAECARVILLSDQIATRIRPFCAEMSEEELRLLAERMAKLEHKFATAGFPAPKRQR
jgi:hypothetical protein